MTLAHQVILEMPPTTPMARHMRSTILLSALESVRLAGYGDAYLERLEEPHKQTLLHTVAGTWLPIEVAHAHYRACEALNLSADVQTEIGRRTGEHTRSILLGTVAQLAKQAGVTPWTLIPHLQKFWDRGYDGGGMTIVKVGPKEARIDILRCSLCEFRHFRNALRGLVMVLMDYFCSRSFVTELPGKRPDATAYYKLQWA